MRTLYKIVIITTGSLQFITQYATCNDNVNTPNGDIPTSYFFSDKESNAILSLLNKNKDKCQDKSLKTNKKTVYKLSGILFVNAHNWTVWINNKPYHSIGQYNDFFINAVSSNSVLITCKDGNEMRLRLDTVDQSIVTGS